jgi:bifunctional UDP-N-acetylglucosamine pyrophosphorylase/glucosamine-1-phosphate N-acetyltransferase
MLNILVLAAGQGTRMRSALPKVLHRLAGRPLLAHVLDTARSLEPVRLAVVHGHGGEAVRAAFPQADLQWVEQREQRGTGHAVREALHALDPAAMVLILYGDVPLIRAQTLRALVEAGRAGLAVLTVELAEPAGYGRIVRADSRVLRIVEAKDATAEELRIREVNAGFFALPASRLAAWVGRLENRNAQCEYYLTDIVGMAVADGVPVATVAAEPVETAGVNSKAELAQAERALQAIEARRLLDAGVTLADPARIDVRGSLRCARDVTIDVNCVFEGEVILGEGVSIGPNCVLRNVSVAAGTEIHAFSHLDEAAIGERCRIGPYARLRPGTQLAEDVHIGNFVEVKAGHFARGAKANHLSYIGDAEVGARVNIGAGTITCNYDGVAKHRTIIGDDCFVGSDTTLVAPVTLARGSYIGAGSTISKNTPPDQLTVARARQMSVPGWKPPRKP